MRTNYGLLLLALAGALIVAACNNSGLSNRPRGTFSQLACLDVNRDHVIGSADAADPSELPDFNADDSRDDDDAAFLRGVEIALDPAFDYAQCDGKAKESPEYLVAHGYFDPSEVSCDDGATPVLIVGVGGGAVNVKNKNDAAGIRKAVDKLLGEYEDRDTDAIALIAGPAIGGAQNPNAAMEEWTTHAVRVYLDRYPCLRAVLVGHSLGAVTIDVAGARLEGEYAERIIAVVDIDRIGLSALYSGDVQSRPAAAYVFNIYETNDDLHADAYNSPNAENWDASAETAPENGDEGGPEEPVDHTTIDNSPAVHDRIVQEVVERS